VQNKYRKIFFIALCLVQISVPAAMILKRELTLRYGTQYLFKTAPVDPYDAFRGRYVALFFDQNTISGDWSKSSLRSGSKAYALLGVDSAGFAYISHVQTSRPKHEPYIQVRIAWVGTHQISVELPFDRFFMQEFDAPKAEREFLRIPRSAVAIYAQVRVRKGFAVVADLMIDGVPVGQWLPQKGLGVD
jgi:uncharacterized membrane-anchored protein